MTLTVSSTGGWDTLIRTSYITTCRWADVVCDCEVNVSDIQAVASAWRCIEGEVCYHGRCDVDDHAVITVVDIMQIAAEWG